MATYTKFGLKVKTILMQKGKTCGWLASQMWNSKKNEKGISLAMLNRILTSVGFEEREREILEILTRREEPTPICEVVAQRPRRVINAS
nr:hypothetical protein [uncultured Cellulosilyticum sp.]